MQKTTTTSKKETLLFLMKLHLVCCGDHYTQYRSSSIFCDGLLHTALMLVFICNCLSYQCSWWKYQMSSYGKMQKEAAENESKKRKISFPCPLRHVCCCYSFCTARKISLIYGRVLHGGDTQNVLQCIAFWYILFFMYDRGELCHISWIWSECSFF